MAYEQVSFSSPSLFLFHWQPKHSTKSDDLHKHTKDAPTHIYDNISFLSECLCFNLLVRLPWILTTVLTARTAKS